MENLGSDLSLDFLTAKLANVAAIWGNEFSLKYSNRQFFHKNVPEEVE